MKKTLTKIIIMSIRGLIYGTALQVFFLGFLLAKGSEAQVIQSVRDVKITLSLKNASLQECFAAVERQTDYRFSYDHYLINKGTRINYQIIDRPVSEFLLAISQKANLRFKQINNNINVQRSSNSKKERNLEVVIQGVTVTGKVISSEDQGGVPGVNVIVKGTTNGTVTDYEGKYTLEVPGTESVLMFSSIGFASEEVTVGTQSVIDVTLSPDVTALEEIVVVGYGTQKREDLTGSIVSADSKMIQERGTTNAVQALQGQVAGVTIQNNSGRVGDSYNFNIRGKSKISGDNEANNPLFVVDGVITDNIDWLNPNDIAKIDILKDASSQAIYGSRGSNGVVFVQTKGGANIPSGTNISVDTYYGIKKTARLPEMMSPEKWRRYHYSAYLGTTNNGDGLTPQEYNDVVANTGSNAVLLDRFNNLQGFDWYDAVLKDGMQSNTNVMINHRNGGSAYSLGIGYQKETGNIDNEGLDRFTLRLGMDQEVNDKWKAGAQANISTSTIERGSDLAMREAFRLNPFLSPWAIDDNGNEIVGELFNQPGKLRYPTSGDYAINKTSTWNPLLEIANASDETRQLNAIGSTYLQFTPVEWIILKSTLSAGYLNYRRGKAFGERTNSGNSKGINSSVNNYTNFNFTLDNQVNFIKSIDKHDFNLLFLQSTFVNQAENSEFSSSGQPFESGFQNVGSGPQSTYNLGNSFEKSQLLSYAVRLNYTFNGKYLITASNRWDGSSKLAEGLKWQSFPSVALGWQLSEENFIPESKWISNLKLRFGYGKVGNQAVKPYSSVSTLDQQTYYDFNGTSADGFIASNLANENLTWEVTTEINFGLDFGMLDYRITGSIDLYNRLTDGQILEQTLPKETGFEKIFANAGEVRNKGVEISLNTVNIQTPNVTWETSFTFSKNTNTIESLYGKKESDIGNGWHIGESIDAEFDYKFAGIWQSGEATEAASYNAEEGHVKVEDINNDGAIDADNDRIILGSKDPSWTGGFTSRLTVSNFDLNISLYTVQGVFTYSEWHANFIDMSDRGRQKFDVPDWYIPSNGAGVEPMVSNQYPQPRNTGSYTSALYYKDASYLKIQNISLGYTLPKSLVDNVGIDHLRVFVNIINPFVFTDYEGWDPEWATGSYNVSRVSNVITQFGLNLKF